MREKAKKELKLCKNCKKQFCGNGQVSYCSTECRIKYWNNYRKRYFKNEYYPLHKEELIQKVQRRTEKNREEQRRTEKKK